MSLIDIKAVKSEARAAIAKEEAEKATKLLVAQLRVVETAKKLLAAEEQKLADLEARIEEGQA